MVVLLGDLFHAELHVYFLRCFHFSADLSAASRWEAVVRLLPPGSSQPDHHRREPSPTAVPRANTADGIRRYPQKSPISCSHELPDVAATYSSQEAVNAPEQYTPDRVPCSSYEW